MPLYLTEINGVREVIATRGSIGNADMNGSTLFRMSLEEQHMRDSDVLTSEEGGRCRGRGNEERNRDEREALPLQWFVYRNQRGGATRCVGESLRRLPRRLGVGMRSKEPPELLDRI